MCSRPVAARWPGKKPRLPTMMPNFIDFILMLPTSGARAIDLLRMSDGLWRVSTCGCSRVGPIRLGSCAQRCAGVAGQHGIEDRDLLGPGQPLAEGLVEQGRADGEAPGPQFPHLLEALEGVDAATDDG